MKRRAVGLKRNPTCSDNQIISLISSECLLPRPLIDGTAGDETCEKFARVARNDDGVGFVEEREICD